MSHRGKNRFILAFAAATLVASLSAGAVAAGEITGNGKLKDVNGHSACAFSGQEDLQWYLDDENTMPRPRQRSSRASRATRSRGDRSRRRTESS